MSDPAILIINPGSTSTKVALFTGEEATHSSELRHDADQLARHPSVWDQLPLRRSAVRQAVGAWPELDNLEAVVGRGGLMRPVPSGTYLVNEAMLEDLRTYWTPREHASSLGAPLAVEMARPRRLPAFVVDPVVTDEMWPVARVTGWADVQRVSLSHALSMKAAARRCGAEIGRLHGELALVVAHMGGGISVSAHQDGRMVDTTNPIDGEGPIAPERAGNLPAWEVAARAYGGSLSPEEMRKRIVGRGGLVSLLGTNSLIEVETRVDSGDRQALLVFEALAYNISKWIGAMYCALERPADAIVLTGGLARSERLMNLVIPRSERLARVFTYPGSDEMLAMAQGALRVLRGEEVPSTYPPQQ